MSLVVSVAVFIEQPLMLLIQTRVLFCCKNPVEFIQNPCNGSLWNPVRGKKAMPNLLIYKPYLCIGVYHIWNEKYILL
jgi:hypothetical protein